MVWNKLNEDHETHLLHIADGLLEFEHNWRIQSVLQLTGRPCTLVKHEFSYAAIEKHAVSYLRREGHPWAALCLFDGVLVCIFMLIADSNNVY